MLDIGYYYYFIEGLKSNLEYDKTQMYKIWCKYESTKKVIK